MDKDTYIDEHEAMDEILEFLIKKREENKGGEPQDMTIHSRKIHKELFPDDDYASIALVLQKISETKHEIVKSQIRNDSLDDFDGYFMATGIASKFLNNQGGFTKAYEQKKKKEIFETKKASLQMKVHEDTLRVNRWHKVFFVVNAVLIAINIALAIITFLEAGSGE